MKIAVIGANSYIARNLIYTLRVTGEHELYLYDREETHKDNAPNYRRIDILDRGSVAGIDLDTDLIYMFVGKTGTADGFDNPDVYIDINERAMLYVLGEYVKQGSKAKIIFPSTRLLYGDNDNACEEDISENLKTVYAVNKLACEQYIKMYHTVYGVSYCIVRICIPYGNFLDSTYSYGTIGFMLSKATKGENITLYGDGGIRRTLTYIGDLCEYLIRAGSSPECANDVYNIGGESFSLREMATLVADRFGVGVEYTEYPDIAKRIESGDTVFDATKLEKTVGRIEYKRFADWLKEKER